jgi:SAM-dependent methyltransferase
MTAIDPGFSTLRCIICGDADLTPVPFSSHASIDAHRRRLGETRPYAWFLCQSCGNAMPSHQPGRAVLEAVWNESRASKQGEDTEATWAHRRRIAAIGADRSWECFGDLRGGSEPGRFLDIGCGLGYTVRKFANHGWQASGIDPDITMKEQHERIGITSLIGPFEDMKDDQTYSMIQIAYAIYFITDPMMFLARVRDMLERDGIVAIVLADLLTYTQPVGPSYVHTWLPTAESLEQALALAGFRVIRRKRIKDSWFIAATPGKASELQLPIQRILWRHRTRALRWAMLGAPRQVLAGLVKKMLKG